jgi:hypothetical protein
MSDKLCGEHAAYRPFLQSEQQLAEPKQQSKLISRRLTEKSEPACSIETGNFLIQYVGTFRRVRYLLIIRIQLPPGGPGCVPHHLRQVVSPKTGLFLPR